MTALHESCGLRQGKWGFLNSSFMSHCKEKQRPHIGMIEATPHEYWIITLLTELKAMKGVI